MKKTIFISIIFLSSISAHSQSTLTSVRQQINNINTVYQNASNLTFDISVSLSSDTALSYFENELEKVKYIINGNNFFYATNEAEFMQDDTFAITAFKSEQTMIVVRKNQNVKDLLPLKNFTDSSLHYYFLYYTVTASITADGDKEIVFKTDSAWAYYKKIRIKYDSVGYLLSEVEFSYNEEASPKSQVDGEGNLIPETLPILSKNILMKFNQYSFNTNPNVFNYSRYIYYDRMKKEYLGAGQYKGYRVLTSNISNSLNNRDDVEIPAPSGANKY